MDHTIEGSNLIPKRNAKHLFRRQIFEAWEHKCAYCGLFADTLDHIRSRYKGGTTTTNNLVPACKECNRKKGSEEWMIWFSRQKTWTLERVLKIKKWMQF